MPEDPIKEGHTFTGWIGNYTNVTKPADINASFDIKTYRVTFKDYNGAILKESYVEHGADAIPPANPSREGHTFDGWAAADYEDIIKDKEIVAKYTIKSMKLSSLMELLKLAIHKLYHMVVVRFHQLKIQNEKVIHLRVGSELIPMLLQMMILKQHLISMFTK